ncbi:hypothetical protein BKA61DRAFT_179236 [Leptodontidium sp. MPI-SDFR-AT-0119]|nr:hypothetical protein BKA61DRAFT_179236 [Leptodontidium sp. MPI-SDFR-AT-0119]
MAPIQTQPPKLFARDIAAFNDTELDQYLAANGRCITVEDPETLKGDEVLLRRLRARTGATKSRSIDLDDLTARLQDISAKRDWQAQPRRPSQIGSAFRSRATTESIDDEEYYQHLLREETKCYNTLVSEGGRPSHPVSLGRDILDSTGEDRELLSYWQFDTEDWQVFRGQMHEWKDFRRYQRSNREEGRFSIYVNAVKRSFARHEFTRLFELDEDLERQDKLTTWIEYLDYEYWKQDKATNVVKRLQLQYDEAWKKLVDSRLLKPFETKEFICNSRPAHRYEAEEVRAKKAVESANSAAISAQNETKQRLAAARSQLATAIKLLESIKRRNDLVREFYKKRQSYQKSKDDTERRSILLRWILRQIPLIELELDQVTENDSNLESGKTKRKRHLADHFDQERVPKRQKEDSKNDPPTHQRKGTHLATTPSAKDSSFSTRRLSQAAMQEGQLKCKSQSATEEGQPVKRPRYSNQTSNTAETHPLSSQPDRPEPKNSATQVPKLRKPQAKVHTKERESRRIAGLPPQFGMLSKRGAPASPYVPPSRQLSNTRKRNSSSSPSQASFKKSRAVRDSKPQGRVTKSRREGTNRSVRSKKRTSG